MNELLLATVELGVRLGAVVYAGVGLLLVVGWVRRRVVWRCPRCRQCTLERARWLKRFPSPRSQHAVCPRCGARSSVLGVGIGNDACDSEPSFGDTAHADLRPDKLVSHHGAARVGGD